MQEEVREMRREAEKARQEAIQRTKNLKESKRREQEASYSSSVFEAEARVLQGKLASEQDAHHKTKQTLVLEPVYCPPQKCTSEEVSLRVTVPLWYNPGRTNLREYKDKLSTSIPLN
eukprot:1179451-Prorocentrum_minimum.AAC.1